MNIDYVVSEWDFLIPEKAGVEVFACNIRRIVNEAWIKEAAGFYIDGCIQEIYSARVRVYRDEEHEFTIRHTSVVGIDAEVCLVVRTPTAFHELWFRYSDYINRKDREEEIFQRAEITKFIPECKLEKYVVCYTGKAENPYVLYCDGMKHEYGEEVITRFRHSQDAQLFIEMLSALSEGRRIF